MAEFKNLRIKTNDIIRELPNISNYIKAVCLLIAYNTMIRLADTRMSNHPEAIRAPSLRYAIVGHFTRFVTRHVSLSQNRIFDDLVLSGSNRLLQSWQESGYRTRRTANNYRTRLVYWQAIFDESQPIIAKRVPSKSEDVMSKPHYRIKVLDRVRRHGKIVTYEDVIYDRNSRFAEVVELVPFLMPFNYGTSFGSRPGYPNVPGLHFIEDAERSLSNWLRIGRAWLDEYLLDTFINNKSTSSDVYGNLLNWVSAKRPKHEEYISIEDYARELSFGLPF